MKEHYGSSDWEEKNGALDIFTDDIIHVVLDNLTGTTISLTICTDAVGKYMKNHYKTITNEHNKYSNDTIIIMIILKRIIQTLCESSTISKKEIEDYYHSLNIPKTFTGGYDDNYQIKYEKYKSKYIQLRNAKRN